MFRMSFVFSAVVAILVSVLSSTLVRSQTVVPPAIEWERTFWWFNSAFQQTDDGGYVFATASGLVKTDAAGDQEWKRQYNVGDAEFYALHSVRQTTDGGYILSGWSQPPGQYNLRLVKTNAAGQLEWQKLFNGFGDASGYAACQTSDGGYAVIGSKFSVRLLKTDAAGTLLWQKDFAGVGFAMQRTDDDGFIIVGSALTKANASGNLEWQKGISGYDVKPTDDGGYIVIGDTKAAGDPLGDDAP